MLRASECCSGSQGHVPQPGCSMNFWLCFLRVRAGSVWDVSRIGAGGRLVPWEVGGELCCGYHRRRLRDSNGFCSVPSR